MEIITPDDGLHPGTSFEDYLKWNAMSSSKLRGGERRSMLHAKYAADQMVEKPAFTKGTLFHATLLEPGDSLDHRFAFEPAELENPETGEINRRVKAYQTWKNDQELPIARKCDVEVAERMANAVMATSTGRELLGMATHREVSAIATDPATAVRIKCRYDLITEYNGKTAIVDFKTIGKGATDREIGMAIWNHAYHMQAELYQRVYRGVHDLHNRAEPMFIFCFVESAAPHGVRFIDAAEWVGYGAAENDQWLYGWIHATQTNHYPGYVDKIEAFPVPKWVDMKFGQEWDA